jgi:glyoxylase-like metal-dependent hydrolase (beta-lactamase superfamily II)
LVEPNTTAVTNFFAFNKSPAHNMTIDLGGRKITVIKTPGHQEDAITVYDSQTKWLLTGDTFYPGLVYVKNWDDYKNSIERMVLFSNEHEVSAVLGAHIEMTKNAGEYYPIGTVYQPNETSLVLSIEHLKALDAALKKSEQPNKIVFDEFIIEPMNGFQKTLSNIGQWFSQ